MPSPDPNSLWQWMLSFFLVLAGLKLGFDFWKAHISPHPPLHKEYTTIHQHDALSQRVDGLQAEARAGHEALLRKIEQYDKERRESVSRAYKAFETAIREMDKTQAENVKEMSKTLSAFVEKTSTAIGEMKGTITLLNQQHHSLSNEVHTHIANDK